MTTMLKRGAGILMPVSSLPSPYGIGTFGTCAYEFADNLKKARQSYWQVLPLGPTSYGDSPYQSFSAFAGNPYFIDLDTLAGEGLLTKEEIDACYWCDREDEVKYDAVYYYRFPLLRKAYERSGLGGLQERRQTAAEESWENRERKERGGNGGAADGAYAGREIPGAGEDTAAGESQGETGAQGGNKRSAGEAYEAFCRENGHWLDDYALYMALKGRFDNEEWLKWDEDIRLKKPEALLRYRRELADEIGYWKFLQFKFYEQWDRLKSYVNGLGIKIIGDIPIYVALDSADVWVHPELFQLDKETRRPLKVAGVPPDAFSDDGQLWGNPLYDWDKLEETGFAWWKDRMRAAAKLYDVVRIDHFIGVVQYYSIPYGTSDGKTGEWKKGPGEKLTDAIREAAGDTKIIAEDLGIYCPPVKELLKKTGYPGMKIIEFAFSGDRFNEHLPHCYEPNCVVYGGTHDNETLAGYFRPEARQWWELQYIADYLGAAHHEEVPDKVFRAAYGSVASVAVFQMQDVLGLGNEARMNTPGTVGGNWKWRMRPGAFGDKEIGYLSFLVDTFGRF